MAADAGANDTSATKKHAAPPIAAGNRQREGSNQSGPVEQMAKKKNKAGPASETVEAEVTPKADKEEQAASELADAAVEEESVIAEAESEPLAPEEGQSPKKDHEKDPAQLQAVAEKMLKTFEDNTQMRGGGDFGPLGAAIHEMQELVLQAEGLAELHAHSVDPSQEAATETDAAPLPLPCAKIVGSSGESYFCLEDGEVCVCVRGGGLRASAPPSRAVPTASARTPSSHH